MSAPKIKICGLTRQEDIEAVNQYLPDYIGFVFAPGKRLVTPSVAAGLKKNLDSRIMAVGVFVNSPVDSIAGLATAGTIDAVQLHGDEDAAYILELKKRLAQEARSAIPVIKAIRVKTAGDIEAARNFPADYLLFDTYTKGAYGGSGIRFNWDLLPPAGQAGEDTPAFFLAGGIDSSNIRQAAKTGAFCIDVSSGAETDGKKDPAKIKELIQIIRSTPLCQKENLDSTEGNSSPKR